MEIVGFDLSKIFIERKNNPGSKWDVSTKIDIKDISKDDKIKVIEGKDIIKFNFEYTINYEPKLADISFTGFLLLLEDSKKTKEVLNEWSKKKEVLSEVKLQVFNVIFYKCNLKALQLETELNLPPHLQLPTIKEGQKEDNKSKASYTG